MLDNLLADIAARGWLVNNCYQVDARLWRANLRRPTSAPDGDFFTTWAEAPTLAEALEECCSRMLDAEFSPTTEQTYSIEISRSLADQIAASLRATASPIRRRV